MPADAVSSQEIPRVRQGVLDLSSWNFEARGPVKLDGSWEFHWRRLIGPGDKARGAGSDGPFYITVPGYWNGTYVNGEKIEGRGHATFRLLMKLPDADREYALHVPQLYTAYRLWIDDRPMSENGTVGDGPGSSVPSFLPRLVIFRPHGKDVVFTLQVSNYHHVKGGFWSSIIIDNAPNLIRSNRYSHSLDMLAFGGLLLMGIYHLSLFILRRKDRVSLYFGLFCLVTALRVVVEGNRLFIDLLPGFNWELNEKLSYLTFFFIVILFNLYIHKLLPEDYPAVFVKASTWIGLVCAGAVIVTRSEAYYHLLVPFQVNATFWGLLAVFVMGRAVKRKRDGIWYLIGGFLLFAAAGLNDMLYHVHLSPVGDIVHFGFLAFVFSQSVIISMRFSHAYASVETLSAEKTKLFADAMEIISSLILESSTRLYEFTRNATRIAVLLARKTGLSETEVEEIRIAAMLHDLGMISVNKRMAICNQGCDGMEKGIVENHPLKSNEIIKNLRELSKVMLIIAQHHERYDGSGYPLSLKKNEIHPGARIIGLADDFVEMLSKRDFQTVEKKARIKSALLGMRGITHDPVLVDALLEIMESEKLIYDIREEDVKVRRDNGTVTWEIPSNKYFETIVVDRVIAEIVSGVGLDRDTAFSIDFSLCEVVRNAIIHGNKYDEKKRVVITLKIEDADARKKVIITVRDEGEGMDLREYNRYSESSEKLRQIAGLMRQHMEMTADPERKDEISRMIGYLNDFRAKYYIDFNTYRQIDSSESTGGVGLIHVLKSFDRVEYRNLVENYSIKGLEVVMVKYI
jgi:anti-sigma regulatory factor (Ser/Thr protein kinase)